MTKEELRVHRKALYDAAKEVAQAIAKAQATYDEVEEIFSKAKLWLSVTASEDPRGSAILSEETFPL